MSNIDDHVRAIVRDEFAKAVAEIADAVVDRIRSRIPSPAGIGAPVEGEDRCDEATNRGSMDPISTETCGDSMSLQEAEEDGRRLIEAIQRGIKPRPRLPARARRRRALP